MAVELIRHSDGRLDAERLRRFLTAFQTVAPLTIGELWAWPSMLKVALIENLRRPRGRVLDAAAPASPRRRVLAAARATAPTRGRQPPRRCDQLPSSSQLLQRMREYGPHVAALRAELEERLAAPADDAEDAIRAEDQHQAAGQVSIANSITSLRLCATLDWSRFFERVSLVEQILQRDPAGRLRRMDFASRDRYRHASRSSRSRPARRRCEVALRASERRPAGQRRRRRRPATRTSATT